MFLKESHWTGVKNAWSQLKYLMACCGGYSHIKQVRKSLKGQKSSSSRIPSLKAWKTLEETAFRHWASAWHKPSFWSNRAGAMSCLDLSVSTFHKTHDSSLRHAHPLKKLILVVAIKENTKQIREEVQLTMAKILWFSSFRGKVRWSKSFWWHHMLRPKQCQKVPIWKVSTERYMSCMPCALCCYARFFGQPSPMDQRGNPFSVHTFEGRTTTSKTLLAQKRIALYTMKGFFSPRMCWMQLESKRKHGFQIFKWVGELKCLTSIYRRTPSPNHEIKQQLGYIVRCFNTFSLSRPTFQAFKRRMHHPWPATAASAVLHWSRLQSPGRRMKRKRETRLYKSRKSHVDSFSKATPNGSQEKAYLFKIHQAKILWRKTGDSCYCYPAEDKKFVSSGQWRKRVWPVWPSFRSVMDWYMPGDLIRYIQTHAPVLLRGFLSPIEHWHKSCADFTSHIHVQISKKIRTSSGICPGHKANMLNQSQSPDWDRKEAARSGK